MSLGGEKYLRLQEGVLSAVHFVLKPKEQDGRLERGIQQRTKLRDLGEEGVSGVGGKFQMQKKK